MISPGSIVRHRAFGNTSFVVQRLRDDGLVDIVSKATTAIGRVYYSGLPASLGDLTEVTPAPVYSPGAVLTRSGVQHTVLSDDGDGVSFLVGESFYELRDGYRVRLPAGDTTTISKADLILDAM